MKTAISNFPNRLSPSHSIPELKTHFGHLIISPFPSQTPQAFISALSTRGRSVFIYFSRRFLQSKQFSFREEFPNFHFTTSSFSRIGIFHLVLSFFSFTPVFVGRFLSRFSFFLVYFSTNFRSLFSPVDLLKNFRSFFPVYFSFSTNCSFFIAFFVYRPSLEFSTICRFLVCFILIAVFSFLLFEFLVFSYLFSALTSSCKFGDFNYY